MIKELNLVEYCFGIRYQCISIKYIQNDSSTFIFSCLSYILFQEQSPLCLPVTHIRECIHAFFVYKIICRYTLDILPEKLCYFTIFFQTFILCFLGESASVTSTPRLLVMCCVML